MELTKQEIFGCQMLDNGFKEVNMNQIRWQIRYLIWQLLFYKNEKIV